MMGLFEEQADHFLDDEDAKELAQVEVGKRDELEHTNDPELALRITLQHLAEDPDYYFKIKPALENRRGYQIDLVAVSAWTEELVHISLVSEDRGAEWKITRVHTLQGSDIARYIQTVLADTVANSMGRTYYECVVANYNTALTTDSYWYRLMELAGGFGGLHMGLSIATTPSDFLNAVERTCIVNKRISLF